MRRKLITGLFVTLIMLSACIVTATAKTAMSAVIRGKVKNTAGEYVSGIKVDLVKTSDMSQAGSAMTSKDGSFEFKNIKLNERFWIMSENTADGKYLAGQLRKSIMTDKPEVMVQDMEISGRPDNKAVYVGSKVCRDCHADTHPAITAGHQASAHTRIITMGQKAVIDPMGGWGKDNDSMGVKTGFSATPPDGSDTPPVPVTACTKNGVKGFTFGGDQMKPCDTGVFIPIAATLGGQGDRYVDPKTGKMMPNVGVFKQHFLAKLTDVPATTSSWENYPYPGSDKDFVMLPLYIAQSGTLAPNFVPFRAVRSQGAPAGKATDVQAFRASGTGNLRNSWVDQGQEYSQACAGCHVVGLKITTGGTKGVYTNSFNYVELGVGCENCHGPGSEHADNPGKSKGIIQPSKLTATSEREVCAKCHGLALPASASPVDAVLFPWNDKHQNDVGNGGFIAGIYKLADFMPGWMTGKGFFGWDKKNGRHHKQQSYEFEQSKHVHNDKMSLTCTACHSAHSLYQGPAKTADEDMKGNVYNFKGTMFKNNTVCLRCHAEGTEFKELTKSDVALLNAGYGQPTYMNGAEAPMYDVSGGDASVGVMIAAAQNKVAKAVVMHMNRKAGMGMAVKYDPTNDKMPVGRCYTCHMPKTGMMGGYTWSENAAGEKAMIEGDVVSHAGEIIYPADAYAMYHSAAMNKDAKNQWKNIMPTSCGKCHDSGRYYMK